MDAGLEAFGVDIVRGRGCWGAGCGWSRRTRGRSDAGECFEQLGPGGEHEIGGQALQVVEEAGSGSERLAGVSPGALGEVGHGVDGEGQEVCGQWILVERWYSVPSSAISTCEPSRRNAASPPERSSAATTAPNTGNR